jgi:hypothetical protein
MHNGQSTDGGGRCGRGDAVRSMLPCHRFLVCVVTQSVNPCAVSVFNAAIG